MEELRESAAIMAELRPLRRIAIAAAWLLATYAAPAPARAQPAPPAEATACAVGQVDAVSFRAGTAAGTLGASSAIADFNHDGRPDLAVADRTGRTGASRRFRLEVELSGVDTVSLDIDSTESALALSLADVDHDDDLDIVLSRPLSGETVGVWLNDGAGRFTSAPSDAFHAPPRPLRGIDSRSSSGVRPVAALPSREFRAVVTIAVVIADTRDAAQRVSGPAQLVRPTPSFPISRPRPPPPVSGLLS